jgi:hypothetical protein
MRKRDKLKNIQELNIKLVGRINESSLVGEFRYKFTEGRYLIKDMYEGTI